MVQLRMLLASHNADTGTNASYDPKNHAAAHFYCLDLRNAMVLFMMLSASHDRTPVQMVSHDHKSLVALHFSCLGLRNAMVPLAMSLASCSVDVDINEITCLKESSCISF